MDATQGHGNPRLVDEEIRRQRELVDQLSRNPAMLSGELETIARVVTESCARLLDLERVGIWMFDEPETTLRCIDQFNLGSGCHSSGAVLHEHEFQTEFQALKRSLYVDASDPMTDPRTAGYVDSYLRPNRITSMLDVVIRFGGQNLGTLCFEHVDRPHTWAQRELDFGCMVGAQLSVLLERRALRRAEDERRSVEERLRASQELESLKSQFLANISHELRTPLMLLIGPTEDLLGDAPDEPTRWQRGQLETIHRAARRLDRLVNALLDFVATEAGRVHATFEPTDLATLTRNIVSMFDSSAVKAGLQLRVECEPLPEPAYVDREMWEKIILNLVSNALKFTLGGEIVVTQRVVDGAIELAIRDTGIGIPAEALPRVFDRFYRVSGAQGRTIEGAGIGLALTKELVELHGGEITVDSQLGEGSTFRVRIPRGHAHVSPERLRAERPLASSSAAIVEEANELLTATPEPAVVAPIAARARILAIDDNADMRAYLSRILAERYEVVTASDGVDALDAVRTRPPDLVVSDVMMPRLDGLGLLRALRAGPETAHLPVILISARAGEDATVEALGSGADDYLAKPFGRRELLARVATHLELVRARREAAEAALKDEFLQIASHELRTPISSLQLRFQLAQQRLAAGAATEASEALAGSLRAIARLEALAVELTSVSEIDAGAFELRTEPSDVVAICRAAAEAEALASRRPISLDVPPLAVEAPVDPLRLGEAIRQLLSNALKYSPPGTPVVLSLQVRGAKLAISVRDRGGGIPAEEQPRLFERFRRVPGIGVQGGSRIGLGVGLFVARAIIERHGGRIDVASSPGGSTFTALFPRRAS